MNYHFNQRLCRTPRKFSYENSNKRGVVYPSINDFYTSLRQGDDVSKYVVNTPFVSGNIPVRYEEFDEVVMRNRYLLDALATASKASKAAPPNPSVKTPADDEHSEEDKGGDTEG